MRYKFLTDCVRSNDGEAIRAMVEDCIDITRETFLKHVDKQQMIEMEQGLGYEKRRSKQGLTMARDWAVSYHRSTYQDKPCYYFRWSGIEHIFTVDGEAGIGAAHGAQKHSMPV